MSTVCTEKQLEFHAPGRREIAGRLDGGCITSDGGGLLLREVDLRNGDGAMGLRFFCRDWLMSWCEDNSIGYVVGLAHNQRLRRAIGTELQQARVICERTGAATIRATVRKVWLSFSESYPYARDISQILGSSPRQPIWVPRG